MSIPINRDGSVNTFGRPPIKNEQNNIWRLYDPNNRGYNYGLYTPNPFDCQSFKAHYNKRVNECIRDNCERGCIKGVDRCYH